jgi:peptidoglycan hydrolase-like protein with peptidoglycan-binding domain
MRRRAVLTGAALAVAASSGGGWWWLRGTPAPPAVTGVATGTATVTRTDLSATTTVQGTLGYAGAYDVYWQGPGGGTVTWLPRAGQVITRGHPVLTVDDTQVRLFYGDRPAWRPLALGVTAGPDVRVLENNLVALGYAATGTMTVDGHFTTATAAALRRWQRATHQPVTGELALGAVTVQPGRLRVATTSARVGAPAGGGPLLSGTSVTAVVNLAVPVTDTHLVHLRDAVTVTLPDGKTVPGRVTSLSTVATAPGQDQQDRGNELPSVPAQITLTRQTTGANLDQAPVDVNVVTGNAASALTVPITALVALAGGGYGVYVLTPGTRRLVGVSPGLFSETSVEVRGGGLHEGETVEVPAT